MAIERKSILDAYGGTPVDFPGIDNDFNPPTPPSPTWALPGSPEKLRVIIQRVREGYATTHPDDALTHQQRHQTIAARVAVFPLF